MNRSRFKPVSREVAQERSERRKVKRIARESGQTSPASTKPSKPARKPLSAAAKAGRKRTRDRKAETIEKEARLKAIVRERDDYTCQWPECTFRDEQIPVHHVNERSQRPDEKYNPDNCKCICHYHHDYAHHTVEGRRVAKEYGLLGGVTYEKARKENVEIPEHAG